MISTEKKYIEKNNEEVVKIAKEVVEDFYELEINEKSRKIRFVDARRIYFKLVRDNTKLSLQSIGKTLNKDHATVLHLNKTTKNIIETDPKFLENYNKIQEYFQKRLNGYKTTKEIIEELKNENKKLKSQINRNNFISRNYKNKHNFFLKNYKKTR